MRHLPQIVLSLALLAASAPAATPATPDGVPATAAARWFGTGMTARPGGTDTVPLLEVRGLDGKIAGWLFRTDRVPPVVRGMRGEIGVLVALGTDGTLKGIEVLSQREDAKWFNRLRAPFYDQFKGLNPVKPAKPPDTVTGSTVSSKAIVNDVAAACKTVEELPAVKAALLPAK